MSAAVLDEPRTTRSGRTNHRIARRKIQMIRAAMDWHDFEPVERATLNYVLDLGEKYGGTYIGLGCRQLAGHLGIGRTPAAVLLRRLEDRGWIVRKREWDPESAPTPRSRWRVDRFRLTIPSADSRSISEGKQRERDSLTVHEGLVPLTVRQGPTASARRFSRRYV